MDLAAWNVRPPADLDEVREMWDALRRHHAAVGPVIDEAASWDRRRALYEKWLAQPGSVVLVAPGAGYAVLEVGGPGQSRERERVAELQTLSVLPEARGRGVGTALVAAIDEHLEELGIPDVGVGVAHGNDGALAFYARAGWRPYSTRLGATPFRPPAAPGDVVVEPVEDFAVLAPLAAALDAQHRLVGPAYLPPQRDPADAFARAVAAVPDDAIVVGDREGLGYAYAKLSPPDDTWDTGPIGYLEALVVDERARGRGIGTALVAAAWRALQERGAQTLWLDVLEGNDRARALYERLGLRPVWHDLYRRL